jgi:hypothetical protein
MADFEAAYNAFGSRYGGGKASGRQGSFARFLDEGEGNFSQFAGGLNSTFKTPSATNGLEESAFAQAGDARNVEQWGNNLNRINQQYDQSAQIGYAGAQRVQQVQQAKEMAKLNAQSAQQGAMFSGISSGLSILGSIGGAAKSGMFGGGGSTTIKPTSWSNSSGIDWNQTPTISNSSYGGSWF